MLNQSSPIVIIGKNAKTGARVNQRLRERGVNTRPVSRTTEIQFDWDNRNTWANALRGAKSAYVTYQPDLAVPRAADDITAFIGVAKAEEIEHLVLLSGRGEEGAQTAEQILINSGLTWNVVRASWFAQNFSESFMAEGILSGELILPATNTPEPFIDVDDIAQVVVAALIEPTKHNCLFEVTGPELLTFQDCVNEIAQQLGKAIKFTEITIDEYLQMLKVQNVPISHQWLLNELFTVVFDGRNSRITDDVKLATGDAATKFSDYVAKTIAAGHWK
ncbi:NmrA family transcriptional regulator [Motilimonas cestriensis]|uniref:NmrA family transcriptional regulator n=1 Tax=Motilimonas cestriensis TaxID=2742685 RepID=A0ABS8W7A4_9GAMM|nr:NmrA family NAD(P)-binding protein [Motilimonas cestriensis]MCE2593643.1 NmrA family transcriptional regulator [Motilimonas cestriensis]